ncbi:carboxypeptidase-like regulatory domain-containing protein [candidate division KSB1 bacterium]
MNRRNLIILFVIPLIALVNTVSAQESAEPVTNGKIKGNVINAASKEPLIGVNVFLAETQIGAATNNDGEYIINNVPAGSYNVVFQYMGFEKITVPDVIVRPDRITFLNEELREAVLEGEQIVVMAGYFRKEEHEPASIYSFNREEVRRSPGSAGDVSRILTSLPSTSQIADNANELMVRGGSPSENGFFVDNILLPNISHFPVQGASGGAIGILNIDFIENVKFSAGGFPVTYGDRLSSIVDIKFREGNREEFDMQLDLSMNGFGGGVEGPLPNKKGSWFFSARRSYMDLLIDLFEAGGIPSWGDIQGKLTYDINSNNKITILDIFGKSWQDYDKEQALESGLQKFGSLKTYQNTLGINWQYIWGKNGYSNTSLSYSVTKNEHLWYSTKTSEEALGNKYTEGVLRLHNVNYFQHNKTNKFEFGISVEKDFTDYDYFFNPYTSRLGEEIPGFYFKDNLPSSKASFFINYISLPASKLTMTFGLRGDYFSFNGNFHLSPRLSAKYKINSKANITGAVGIYYQNLPMFLLSQSDNNKNLKDPKAVHYVLGIEHLLTDDTKMTIEVYDKEYSGFPLEISDPALFVIDDGTFLERFKRYSNLIDRGKAYSRGIELVIQKKLKKNLYGLVSASFFRAKYKDLNNNWRNRIYDNRYLFSIIGGYKPNNKWEMSARWNFSGGIPYTPFDIAASSAAKTGIIDQGKINEARLPDYHSLNFRIDRRFLFQKSSIVTYLSIWNIYNRKNIEQYYWDEVNNKLAVFYQWSLLPIIGIEYEF